MTDLSMTPAGDGGWRAIGALGTMRGKLGHNQVVIAKLWQPTDENGDDDGPMQISWAHVAYPVSMGWQLGTAGIDGMHGFGSFRLSDATHFFLLPLPDAPEAR